METLRGLGSAVGAYVGDGLGESDVTTQVPTATDPDVVDADIEDDDEEEDQDDNNAAYPLLFFYDCESTGFSIYHDHLTEIAAKVVLSPVPLSTPTFSSLVKTSRRIPSAGTHNASIQYIEYFLFLKVTKLTGISTTMLRREEALSVVFPRFMKWLVSTTSEVNSATGIPHYPGE